MKTKMMTMTAALLVAMSAAVWASPAEIVGERSTVNFEARCCGYRGGEGRGWCDGDRSDYGRHGHGHGYCYDRDPGSR